jgi:hypothetical protein
MLEIRSMIASGPVADIQTMSAPPTEVTQPCVSRPAALDAYPTALRYACLAQKMNRYAQFEILPVLVGGISWRA